MTNGAFAWLEIDIHDSIIDHTIFLRTRDAGQFLKWRKPDDVSLRMVCIDDQYVSDRCAPLRKNG